MLLQRILPRYDVAEVHQIVVAAPPDVVYTAIRHADLRDPVIDVLGAMRDLPSDIVRWLRGELLRRTLRI